MKCKLDRDIEQLIRENGIPDVIDALARWSREHGVRVLSRKLFKLHEWIVGK